MLYIVRSNIAHGERMAGGPDRARFERDETVCRLVIPVQLLLIDLLLNEPSQKLVAYGTLAPGESNHSVVDSLDGTWLPCDIEAMIETRRGLPVMTWNPESGNSVSAMILRSAQLSDYWPRLDAFDGSGYRRQLVVVTVTEPGDRGAVHVANAYVAASD